MRILRVRLDARAVEERHVVVRVEDLPLAGARADHEDPARAVAGADEGMRRFRRTVHEIPRAQAPLLALHDEQAFAAEHEEVLLIRLAVVHRARLPRLENVEPDAELRV